MRKSKRIDILLFTCVLLCAISTNVFAFGSNKFEKEVDKEKAAVKLAREMQRGQYMLVTTEELHQIIETKKDFIIIDTMPYDASYKKEHIPGAVQFLFPIPEMVEWDVKETDNKTEDDYISLLGPDKNRQIIVYCGFVKCTRSHNGAMWAKKLGYTNVSRHPGGIYAWKGAGYDAESAK